MTLKIIMAVIIILTAFGFGLTSFIETNIEYADFESAMMSQKKVQVKGAWMRDQETKFDAEQGTFSFIMVDESGKTMNVIYQGARPNNFELADVLVVKGRPEDGCFRASQILTKCPSKYDAQHDQIGNDESGAH